MNETTTESVCDFARREGAAAAGVARVEDLTSAPASADPAYVLDGATAVVTFAVGMATQPIHAYLAKQDRLGLEREMIDANVRASGIALHLTNYLRGRGHQAEPVAANLVYRPSDEGADDTASGAYDPTAPVYPDLAHRYMAVCAGLGHMGRSGNFLLHPSHGDYGAAVILASVVTDAPLQATPALPADANYCDSCGLCRAGCVARFMDFDHDEVVQLGEQRVTYARRRNLARCDVVCGGYTGLSPAELPSGGQWSTWSPGRMPIPDHVEELARVYPQMADAHSRWPQAPGGRLFHYSDAPHRVACAHCQLLCAPTRAERAQRFNILRRAGVVIQHADGTLHAVPPDEATAHLQAMDPETRRLYTG